jgi:diadenosine tetraphosphate (Ap4A) HIT family hydrolase
MTASPAHAPGCFVCGLTSGEALDQVPVYANERWGVFQFPGFEVPGWLMLCLRRHAEFITGLNDAEAATFAPTAAKLSTAIKAATDAERVYMFQFGEEVTHFHVLLAARGSEIPLEQRRAVYYEQASRLRNPAAADAVASRVRALLSD